MLEATKLALDRSALAVQVLESLALAWDERVQPVGTEPHRTGLALASRAAPLSCAPLVVGSCKRPLDARCARIIGINFGQSVTVNPFESTTSAGPSPSATPDTTATSTVTTQGTDTTGPANPNIDCAPSDGGGPTGVGKCAGIPIGQPCC
jgi:hypothetical protein